MAKKTKRDTNGQGTVTPQEAKLYISRRFLAEFYGLNANKLLFAVSELSYGDADVVISPVIAICGSDVYIDLAAGDCKKIANAAGFKQDLYPAIVNYDRAKEVFIFKTPTAVTTTIAAAKLHSNYGSAIVTGYMI